MTTAPAPLLSVTVTLLMVLFYFYTIILVGRLRGKHGIKAPACSGHPEFDRAYRVQMNTLEQLGLMLPLLWVATIYPLGSAWIAPIAALVWVVGRIVYLRGYMTAPEQRGPGAMIGGIATVILLIMAIAGLLFAWRTVLF